MRVHKQAYSLKVISCCSWQWVRTGILINSQLHHWMHSQHYHSNMLTNCCYTSIYRSVVDTNLHTHWNIATWYILSSAENYLKFTVHKPANSLIRDGSHPPFWTRRCIDSGVAPVWAVTSSARPRPPTVCWHRGSVGSPLLT